MRTDRKALAAALALLLCGAVPVPGSTWFTEDHTGVMRIETCGTELCGRIVGVSWKSGEAPPRDVTGAPQCGIVLVNGLKPGEDGRLHGHVRNPEDGRVYGADVWVGGDGDLRLRGYIGLPVFGSTQHWPQFHGRIAPDCRFAAAK